MTHYLLMKFTPGYMGDTLFDLARETYEELARQVPGVHKVRVERNCVARDSNADLMVCMDLINKDALDTYLDHPLHRNFAAQVESCLVMRLTFDHEEGGSCKGISGGA